MAVHTHLVLDFETGEVSGLALPAEGGGSSSTVTVDDFRWNKDLVGSINGVNTVFTTTEDFIQLGNVVIRVYLNGLRLRLGALNDYTVSESGGSGTGYDTVTMAIAPRSGDVITADYIVVP